jgi:tetratricopeptide (TPR) repeat protein
MSKTCWTVLFGLIVSLVALPALAQSRDDNVTACNGAGPDAIVAGCTALIQSGQESNADLALEYIARAYAYYAKDLADEAIADCTQAIAVKPDDKEAFALRGALYVSKALYDQAIADYTKALSFGPDPNTLSNRGAAFSEKGLLDPAIADESAAIALSPTYEAAYANRGSMYVQKGLYDQAITDETTAITFKSDDAEAYDSRGKAYEGKGLHDQAVADYQAALRLDPSNPYVKDALKRLGAAP